MITNPKNRLTNKLQNCIYNPFLHSIIILVIILLITPPFFDRYIISLKELDYVREENNSIYFEDLNLDGISERIQIGENQNNNLYVAIYERGNKIIDQWNFRGKIIHKEYPSYFIGFNSDSTSKIIYVLTQFVDSIFIHAFDPNEAGKYLFTNLFISRISKGENDIDAVVSFHGWHKFDSIRDQALLSVYAGFGLQPRQLVIFDPSNNSLIYSPSDGSPKIFSEVIKKFENQPPIIVSTSYAPANYPVNSEEKIHDRINWLFIYDHKLNYLREPIPFSSYPSWIGHSYFKDRYGNLDNLGYYVYYEGNNWNVELFYLDENLNKIEIEIICNYDYRSYLLWGSEFEKVEYNGINYIFYLSNKGYVIPINKTKEKVVLGKPVKVPQGKYNIVKDSYGNDLISVYTHNNLLWVAKPNLKSPSSIQLPDYISSNPYSVRFIGQFIEEKDDPKFTLRVGNQIIAASLDYNPYFPFRYLIYFSFYWLILGFIMIIRYTHKVQYEKKIKLENEMASLQLKSIKNQIDPHFMLNVLNNISSVFITGQKDIALQYYDKFTYLIKQVLTRTNELRVTLTDELKFIENYLEIEKLRFSNNFCYSISIEGNVNPNVFIPRMLIFTFVENAVKHGLFHSKLDRILNIYVSEDEIALKVKIEDNGIGRKNASLKFTKGTEKGLSIVNQIIEFHKKLYGQKITYEIEDLKPNDTLNSGTSVKLLFYKYSK